MKTFLLKALQSALNKKLGHSDEYRKPYKDEKKYYTHKKYKKPKSSILKRFKKLFD